MLHVCSRCAALLCVDFFVLFFKRLEAKETLTRQGLTFNKNHRISFYCDSCQITLARIKVDLCGESTGLFMQTFVEVFKFLFLWLRPISDIFVQNIKLNTQLKTNIWRCSKNHMAPTDFMYLWFNISVKIQLILANWSCENQMWFS